MTLLKIIIAILAILFTGFGYFIYFRGKYNLINGYNPKSMSERYAKIVGLSEFALGILLIIVFIILCILKK